MTTPTYGVLLINSIGIGVQGNGFTPSNWIRILATRIKGETREHRKGEEIPSRIIGYLFVERKHHWENERNKGLVPP